MDPKDELLAKLRAIDAETASPDSEPELKPVSPPVEQTAEVHPEISTEDFLAKLEALDQDTRPAPPPTAAAVPPLPPPVRTVSQPSRTADSTPKPPEPSSSANVSSAGSSTSSQLSWQPIAAAFGQLKRYTQAQIEARAAETAARQKREAEVARARAWLDELDPLSDDGFWFEQFSERYESRIQAALDFLNPGRSEAEEGNKS